MSERLEPPREGSIGSRWDVPLPAPIVPQCHSCKHYFAGSFTCAAFFPVNIPEEIITNEFDHTEEYSGDEGVLFEAGAPFAVPEQQGASQFNLT